MTLGRTTALAASALVASTAASAANLPSLSFRSDAAEVSAAARLVSAYGVVTSTFRTIAHNRAVGGVPNSYHLLDRAIDIARRPGVTHLEIEAALRRAGYRLVESLDERNHSHFAFAALVAALPAPASVTASTEPPAKPQPRVAADEHGTLSLDLGTQSGGQAALPSKSR